MSIHEQAANKNGATVKKARGWSDTIGEISGIRIVSQVGRGEAVADLGSDDDMPDRRIHAVARQ